MKMIPILAAMSCLAATPVLAQIVIAPADNGAARHEYRADQQEGAAQHDAAKARMDASEGNYGAAQHEQDKAVDHQDRAQDQENRAARDSQGGVSVQIGR